MDNPSAFPELLQALDWAVAEIEGRTRYTEKEQQLAALERARDLLARLDERSAADDDLRSAMAKITDDALPPVSSTFGCQDRARVQAQIAEGVVGLNNAGGHWYRRWRKLVDERAKAIAAATGEV